MSGIWNRVQSILDKLEEERGHQNGLEATTMDYRPERDNPNWPNEPPGPETLPALAPWTPGYTPPRLVELSTASDRSPQPMGLLQPGSYEAAMATAAQAGQGAAPPGVPQPNGTGPQIEEIPIKAMPLAEFEQRRRAAAIYGETAGLRPQMIDVNGNVNDPKNWDPASAQNLQQARTNLATMYGDVNPAMKPKMPSEPNNPIQKQQWDLAMEAAKASMGNQLDPRLENMWMRQEGTGPQVYQRWVDKGLSPLQQMGPFVNTIPASPELVRRGWAVAKGPGAYIDFYGKK